MQKSIQPKSAKITRITCVSLSCPNCEATIDNGTLWGFVTSSEDWNTIPDLLLCPSCGEQIRKPVSPFKS